METEGTIETCSDSSSAGSLLAMAMAMADVFVTEWPWRPQSGLLPGFCRYLFSI